MSRYSSSGYSSAEVRHVREHKYQLLCLMFTLSFTSSFAFFPPFTIIVKRPRARPIYANPFISILLIHVIPEGVCAHYKRIVTLQTQLHTNVHETKSGESNEMSSLGVCSWKSCFQRCCCQLSANLFPWSNPRSHPIHPLSVSDYLYVDIISYYTVNVIL